MIDHAADIEYYEERVASCKNSGDAEGLAKAQRNLKFLQDAHSIYANTRNQRDT